MSATTIPARMSSQKWLPVAITANQTHAGQSSQSAFAHQWRADERHRDTDDQGIGGVQARHRRVRVARRARRDRCRG